MSLIDGAQSGANIKDLIHSVISSREQQPASPVVNKSLMKRIFLRGALLDSGEAFGVEER